MASPDPLTRIAEKLPDKPAVIDDRPGGVASVSSFAALDAEVNRLARLLQSRGVADGDKIVWCGRNSPGVVRAMHAARRIGAASVPLNYRLAPEEAAYVVDHSDAVLVYADAEYADLFAEIRGDLPKVRDVVIFEGAPGPGMLDGDALLAEQSDAALPPREGLAATITYTSGTSGKPKGAMRRGMGDPEQVAKMAAFVGYRGDDVYLTTGPLYHSGPGGFFVLAHALGNTVVLQRRFDPEDWLRLVEKYRVTTTFSAPTPIRRVCRLPAETLARYDRSSMRIMVANAAPWSHALKEDYLKSFPEDSLWEVYGSTELGVNAILEPRDQLRKRGSCGRPAPAVELKLFDEQGREVTEPRVPGELYVRSRTIFDTYYKAHDKYLEDQREGFQTVGDIAYFDEEGYFYICDRKKDMIISGGVNVYPAEIEAALERHPDVDDVAVFGIPDEEWGEAVHAVVVPRPGARLASEALVAFAREHLAGYKVPRSIEFAAEIPRTGSGKILKRVLREPFWRGHESQVS